MAIINKINVGGTDYNVAASARVACSTAAATVAKTATLTGFALADGATLAVTFTYANTAASPTFSVNSSTAAAIHINGIAVGKTAGTSWAAGETVIMVYDGTYWNVCKNIKYDYGTSANKPSSGITGQVYFVTD